MCVEKFSPQVRLPSDDLVQLQGSLGVLFKTIPSTNWTRSGALFPGTTLPATALIPAWPVRNTILVVVVATVSVAVVTAAVILVQRRRRVHSQSYELVNRLWKFEPESTQLTQ
jgi:hypothetical protein